MADDSDPTLVPPELRPLHELADSGLLWLINACVFHPRGLAFSIQIDPESPEEEGWTLLSADEGEPYMFADTPEIHDRYRKANETLEEARRG